MPFTTLGYTRAQNCAFLCTSHFLDLENQPFIIAPPFTCFENSLHSYFCLRAELSPLSAGLCVSLSASFCVRMWGHVYPVAACGGHMLTLGIFLDHLLSHFWRKSLSLSLKVICGGQGSELNSSCYCSSTFTHRVVSQALWGTSYLFCQ